MTPIASTMMCEQAGPEQLVRDVALAEQAGFDFAVISCHYFPWMQAQGHSPYAWSVLGAAAQAARRIPPMTYVTLMDSLRFRVHLADRLRVRPRDVQAMVAGEHGSVPEARGLAHLATAPMSRAARDLGYAWSRWRRRHQARVRWHHYHARLKAARVT